MAEEIYLFIDFDGTINDGDLLLERHVRELAALLAVSAGGGAAAWEAVLPGACARSEARYRERFEGAPLAGYAAWLNEERDRMTREVFAEAGVPLPRDESPADFGKRVQFDALTGVSAAYPGALGALRSLFEDGVRTQLASGHSSEYLLAALIGAGVESYTESKFGPDLVDCAKEGPEYYRRIMDACGADPRRSVVVDDLPVCLEWAREAGASVIQARIRASAPEQTEHAVMADLADLPRLVREVVEGRTGAAARGQCEPRRSPGGTG